MTDITFNERAVDVYVGLGSNMGQVRYNLVRALRALDALPGARVTALSSLYRTVPLGPPQPDYLNAVCLLRTTLSPRTLLERFKVYEREAGRRAGERWGPRPIDLDILLYGDYQCRSEVLTIPHPGLGERAFVLAPLAELAPALVPPGVSWRIGDRAAKVGREGVVRLCSEGDPRVWRVEEEVIPWFVH